MFNDCFYRETEACMLPESTNGLTSGYIISFWSQYALILAHQHKMAVAAMGVTQLAIISLS